MSNGKQKLELTWIGKNEQPKLEPRILIEDPEKSYGDKNTENMLIYGDNLLALKALEQDFTGKIKCIYIDPPFNTGNAFEHYDDSVEHSIWLSLLRDRLLILKNLLRNDGSLIVHLDDQEVHYLKVVLDEIMGRENFITTIAVKSSTPSGLKTTHRDKTIIKTKDLILVYKKSEELRINSLYIQRNSWDTHYSKYLDRGSKEIKNLIDILVENNLLPPGSKLKDIDSGDSKFKEFYLKNRDNIFQTQPVMPEEHKRNSIAKRDFLYSYYDADGIENFALNGRRFVFLKSSLNTLEDGSEDLGVLLCDFWSDIDFQNTQNEGGVSFPAGKKPEKLVFRIIKMFTDNNDIVLDSFLGSGTTAAVAHKMNRRWIGIELGEHCHTHCIPRLQKVCDGTDQGGISEAVEWKGGGGFKYYYLAPSLLKQDKYGNWVIEEKYNADMLAAAMAKHNNFKYQPSEEIYWKQGQSSEKDFIYTTTQFITVEKLDQIHEEMQPDESLLICCKKFSKPCENRYENITIKKIPQMLLGKCEFGREDYSLNIISMPRNENEPEFVPKGPDKQNKVKEESDTPDLFEENNGEDE